MNLRSFPLRGRVMLLAATIFCATFGLKVERPHRGHQGLRVGVSTASADDDDDDDDDDGDDDDDDDDGTGSTAADMGGKAQAAAANAGASPDVAARLGQDAQDAAQAALDAGGGWSDAAQAAMDAIAGDFLGHQDDVSADQSNAAIGAIYSGYFCC